MERWGGTTPSSKGQSTDHLKSRMCEITIHQTRITLFRGTHYAFPGTLFHCAMELHFCQSSTSEWPQEEEQKKERARKARERRAAEAILRGRVPGARGRPKSQPAGSQPAGSQPAGPLFEQPAIAAPALTAPTAPAPSARQKAKPLAALAASSGLPAPANEGPAFFPFQLSDEMYARILNDPASFDYPELKAGTSKEPKFGHIYVEVRRVGDRQPKFVDGLDWVPSANASRRLLRDGETELLRFCCARRTK